MITHDRTRAARFLGYQIHRPATAARCDDDDKWAA